MVTATSTPSNRRLETHTVASREVKFRSDTTDRALTEIPTPAYSYVDANGELQRVEYVADDLGFRVSDSRLPVAPVYNGVAPVFNPELPVAPEDTPEVKAARAAHMAALAAANEAAGERKKREAEPGFAYSFGSLHPHQGLLYNYNYAAPFNYYGLHNYATPYYG